MHYQAWGDGDPLIALHPLALESTAFAGLGTALARRGICTLAADLPGFGKTPAPEGPLTPARLAEAVLELVHSLDCPPLLLGMSMGGRVALEVALTEPDSIRGLVLVAPYLPWRNWRRAMRAARRIDPLWGERLPLERAWPLLRRIARGLESTSSLEHDWLLRASARVVYYSSCPATRTAFLSASRELALDPAFGPKGTWTRLAELRVPVVFLWAGRDRLIPSGHVAAVAKALPSAHQMEIPCSGHFASGPHFRCMQHAMVLAVERTIEAARQGQPESRGVRTLAPCLAGGAQPDDEAHASEAAAAGALAAEGGG